MHSVFISQDYCEISGNICHHELFSCVWCYTWVSTCKQCIHHKRTKVTGLLQPIHCSTPFETIGMDILSPFNPTHNGNRYIIVIVDYFTKWIRVFALPDQLTMEIAKKLEEVIFAR